MKYYFCLLSYIVLASPISGYCTKVVEEITSLTLKVKSCDSNGIKGDIIKGFKYDIPPKLDQVFQVQPNLTHSCDKFSVGSEILVYVSCPCCESPNVKCPDIWRLEDPDRFSNRGTLKMGKKEYRIEKGTLIEDSK